MVNLDKLLMQKLEAEHVTLKVPSLQWQNLFNYLSWRWQLQASATWVRDQQQKEI